MFAVILSVIITKGVQASLIAEWWVILIITLVSVAFLMTIIVIWRQPQNGSKAAFMVSCHSLGEKSINIFLHFSNK